MSSYKDEAYDIMRSLDVDYVLVVFGGVTGYSSDDINKFLWMPVIKEPDYLVNGEYRVDKGAAPKMLNCLMYKLSYYRFGELTTEYGKPPGFRASPNNYTAATLHFEKMASRTLISRANRMKTKLETALQAATLEVEDVSYQHAGHAAVRNMEGGANETHFNVRIVSSEFEGQNLVKRHRMVYDVLSDELQSGLHALSITAKTPKEAGLDNSTDSN